MKTFKPYAYQEKGVDWIISHPRCCLFWGMGTGKTVTTLTALDWLLLLGEIKRVLVIAPKRVAEATWAKEYRKWEHLKGLRISTAAGTAKERVEALSQDAQIYVISRDNVQWLCETQKFNFDTLVIDELSSFKNPSAKRFKALRKQLGRVSRTIGLTGTPAPNGYMDLWSELYLIDQGERLGKTVGGYRDAYFLPGRRSGYIVYDYILRQGAAEMIFERISDVCMSLKKEELELPGQIYETIEITLSKKLKAEYDTFERNMVMQCLDDDGEIVAANAAALTGKLLQFANGAIYDEDRQVHELHALKLDALEELLEQANGESVLVYYWFRHDLDRIKKRIPSCRELKTTSDIEAWNNKEICVAVAHPASVGHGLNLQYGGHIIVWFGLTWSLELYQQANERLNRPGQTRICMVYHLAVAGTHDMRVLRALERKDTSQQALLEAVKLEVLREDSKVAY